MEKEENRAYNRDPHRPLNRASKRICAIVLSAGVSLAFCGCHVDWYSRSSSAMMKDSRQCSELWDGVEKMWHAWGIAMDDGTAERNHEIPPAYWTPPVKALHPIRVYVDVSNTVIVQKIVDGVEYGKYIMTPESSHYPSAGFVSGPLQGGVVSDYHRRVYYLPFR